MKKNNSIIHKKIDIYKKILVPKKITNIQIIKFFKN